MGSRSGDIDPFIPLFLIKELQIPADEVYNILNSQSGLKGISGVSDFRDLLYLAGVKVPAYKPNLKRTKRKRELALLALKVYIYNIQRYVASFSGLLGKVDAVIFSGGVGEHNKFIRQQILSGVNFIKKPRVLIVKADEELMIAKKIMEL